MKDTLIKVRCIQPNHSHFTWKREDGSEYVVEIIKHKEAIIKDSRVNGY